MTSDRIVCERHQGMLKVTLNRPEKANALSRDMLVRLHEVFTAAAEDADLRAMTITGAGERAFCGGADLAELSKQPDDPKAAIWDEVARALEQLPILTVAMINGACIGGALTLALGCDIRIAVPQATFAYPVLRNGLLPGAVDSARLRALIGPGQTSLILLAGARIEAEAALACGLIDRLVYPDKLAASAASLCAVALEAERGHLAAMKALCRGGAA